jgi:hypothetical protein
MKKKALIFLIFIAARAVTSSAQQVADTLFNPPVSHPAYAKGEGPTVVIDAAHNNFHTSEGRFKPFASILKKDGYRITANMAPFSNEMLQGERIMVIANAVHKSNIQQWTLPNPSAFSDSEISAMNQWVKEGGSLFLIADHMPFPGAAEKLAASFGFKFYNGFAVRKGLGSDIFKPGKGLIENSITRGRNATEIITSLQTFTGQAFEIPEDAQPLVVLSSKYRVRLPQTAWQFNKDTPEISGANLVQGAFLKYGKGRVVVFGEAAMFTAQLQGGKRKMGMNESSASQNFQFLLNTVHWLDGLIP